MEDYSYIGTGQIYMRERGVAGGLIEVGNCSALDMSVEEDEKKLLDYTKPGGGTRNSVKRISAVSANVTAHDVNGRNLARFGYGTQSAIATAAVSDEVHVAYKDAFIAFAFLPDDTVAPTVAAGAAAAARVNTDPVTLNELITPATPNGWYYKVTTAGTTAGAPPTFPTTVGATVTDGTAVLTAMGKTSPVVNTDFEVRPGGIFIFPDAALTDGESLTIDYTKANATRVQAIVASGKEYELVFVGLNEARSGKKTKLTMHRVKPGFFQQLALIGEDYAGMQVAAELLQDTSKTGGLSQYVQIDIEEAAA